MVWLVGHLDEPPAGINMPLASGTNELSILRAFEGLKNMMDKDADVDAIALDTNVNANILERLHGKLKTLHQLGLDRVDFRACGIGANRDLMYTLGFILKPYEITAPDVDHMYYVGVNPGTPFRNLTQFQSRVNWIRTNHGEPQLYKDDLTELRFALLINAVSATHARSLACCYTPPGIVDAWSSAKWWVENKIMKGSNYLHNEFVLACLWEPKLAGPPFVVPLDSNYSKHIKANQGTFRM